VFTVISDTSKSPLAALIILGAEMADIFIIRLDAASFVTTANM
jgi:hypothetical protein